MPNINQSLKQVQDKAIQTTDSMMLSVKGLTSKIEDTAQDAKDEVMGFVSNMQNKAEDTLERYQEEKFATKLKKQMEKENK